MSVATIFIDNAPRQANPKQNLLHACLSLGYDLPYFCWHPALGSVGAVFCAHNCTVSVVDVRPRTQLSTSIWYCCEPLTVVDPYAGLMVPAVPAQSS